MPEQSDKDKEEVTRKGLGLCCMRKAQRHHDASRWVVAKGTTLTCDTCGTEIINIGGGWKVA
jgi:hypothetical protein